MSEIAIDAVIDHLPPSERTVLKVGPIFSELQPTEQRYSEARGVERKSDAPHSATTPGDREEVEAERLHKQRAEGGDLGRLQQPPSWTRRCRPLARCVICGLHQLPDQLVEDKTREQKETQGKVGIAPSGTEGEGGQWGTTGRILRFAQNDRGGPHHDRGRLSM